MSLPLPSIVLAPLLIMLGFYLFQYNLLFPIAALSNWQDSFLAAAAPAFILIFASGWANSLKACLETEFNFWRVKPFCWAVPRNLHKPYDSIKTIVLLKSFSDSCAHCLPWLFGEIVIIEALFNAPGLGLAAWKAAKVRDFSTLLLELSWLIGLYGLLYLTNLSLNKWLGQRLASYS